MYTLDNLDKDLIGVLLVIIAVSGFLFVKYNNRDKLRSLFLGMIVACIFGIIDSLFFLTAETALDEYLEKEKIPKKIIPLAVGAISAAISLFIANYINLQLKGRFSIAENPMIDALGIVIGTLIITIIYFLYNKKDINDDEE